MTPDPYFETRYRNSPTQVREELIAEHKAAIAASDRGRQVTIRDEWIRRARIRADELRNCRAGHLGCDACQDNIKWLQHYSLDEVEADMELSGKLPVKNPPDPERFAKQTIIDQQDGGIHAQARKGTSQPMTRSTLQFILEQPIGWYIQHPDTLRDAIKLALTLQDEKDAMITRWGQNFWDAAIELSHKEQKRMHGT